MCTMVGVEAIGVWIVQYTASGAAENISRGVVMVWRTDPSQVGERKCGNAPPVLAKTQDLIREWNRQRGGEIPASRIG